MRRFIGPLLAGLAFLLATPAAAAPTASSNNPAAVRAYARVLCKINPHLPNWQSRDLAKHLLVNANRWKMDANILVAIVSVESAWRTHARSSAGALGLGQLMPGTARTLRVNPHDPYQNLQGSARYLFGLLTKYRRSPHRYALAFAAYNAGPKAVADFGGIPPYAETQHYVVKVMRAWNTIRSVIHIDRPPAAHPGGRTVAADVAYWTASR